MLVGVGVSLGSFRVDFSIIVSPAGSPIANVLEILIKVSEIRQILKKERNNFIILICQFPCGR